MALVIDDRVKETSTTTGTGTYTLAGAVTGFQSFATIGDTNTTWYSATNGTDWETGIGTYTSAGTTLARTTILASSNADAAVNWGAGTKTIVCTLPASKTFVGAGAVSDNALVRFDGTTGNVVQQSSNIIIDDNGRMFFGGTTAPDYSGNTIAPILQIQGTTANTTTLGAARFSADVNPPRWLSGKSRSGSLDAYAVVSDGDGLGEFNFQGADGTDFAPAAIIAAEVDGTPGAGDMPGRLLFKTSADASETPTERMRISSTGYITTWANSHLIPGVLFKVLTANATAASSAAAQPWFPSAGAVTVEADTTYLVEGILDLTNGATSHTTGINFGGTATITNWDIRVKFTSGAVNTTEPSNNAAGTSSLYTAFLHWSGTTAMSTNQVLNATSVLTGAQMEIWGIVRVNAGGTMIPRFQWSANPTGTNEVRRNTWFKLTKIGTGSVVSQGTWA